MLLTLSASVRRWRSSRMASRREAPTSTSADWASRSFVLAASNDACNASSAAAEGEGWGVDAGAGVWTFGDSGFISFFSWGFSVCLVGVVGVVVAVAAAAGIDVDSAEHRAGGVEAREARDAAERGKKALGLGGRDLAFVGGPVVGVGADLRHGHRVPGHGVRRVDGAAVVGGPRDPVVGGALGVVLEQVEGKQDRAASFQTRALEAVARPLVEVGGVGDEAVGADVEADAAEGGDAGLAGDDLGEARAHRAQLGTGDGDFHGVSFRVV